MGKKSLEPPSPSPTGDSSPHLPEDQTPQLSHHLLGPPARKQALGMSLSVPAPHTGKPGELSQGSPWILRWCEV